MLASVKKALFCVMSPVGEFSKEHFYFGIPLVFSGEGIYGIFICLGILVFDW